MRISFLIRTEVIRRLALAVYCIRRMGPYWRASSSPAMQKRFSTSIAHGEILKSL